MTAILLVAAVITTLDQKVSRRPNRALRALLGLALLVALSAYWTRVPSATEERTITFAALAVTGIAIDRAARHLGGAAANWVAGGLMAGALFSAALIIRNRANGDFVLTAIQDRSSAGIADPNDIGLCLAAAVPVFIVRRHRGWGLAGAAVVTLALMFTGSRGGLVALAAALATLVVQGRGAKVGGRRRVLPSLVGIGVALTVAWRWLPDPLVQRISGIPQELRAGSFTGRTELWSAAWAQFVETPFLGTGAGTARWIVLERTGRLLVTHDIYLSLLVEVGLIGGVLIAVAFVGAGRSSWQARVEVPWLLPTFAALFVGTLALSWEYNKLLWLILILACAMQSFGKSQDREKESDVPTFVS